MRISSHPDSDRCHGRCTHCTAHTHWRSGEDRAFKQTSSGFLGNQCACEDDPGKSAQEQVNTSVVAAKGDLTQKGEETATVR